MTLKNLMDTVNAAAAAKAVRERVARAKQLIADLELVVETLEDEPTWPVAGSLGHINEKLAEVLAGFPTVPRS